MIGALPIPRCDHGFSSAAGQLYVFGGLNQGGNESAQ